MTKRHWVFISIFCRSTSPCFEVFFAPEILNGTKAEVYEIAAESGVDYLKRLGLDIAEDVAEDVDKVAATTVCLFFGYLDGAATISESCGGGGSNNELPKKKDNEDELSFARRCHQMAKIMHAPRYKYGRGR